MIQLTDVLVMETNRVTKHTRPTYTIYYSNLSKVYIGNIKKQFDEIYVKLTKLFPVIIFIEFEEFLYMQNFENFSRMKEGPKTTLCFFCFQRFVARYSTTFCNTLIIVELTADEVHILTLTNGIAYHYAKIADSFRLLLIKASRKSTDHLHIRHVSTFQVFFKLFLFRKLVRYNSYFLIP